MKRVLIIGSGISGLTCAVETAMAGNCAVLVSPYPSERAQSVMAAGGINAVVPNGNNGDSIDLHIRETHDGGCRIAGERTVTGLCTAAPHILMWLESLGVEIGRAHV